MCWQNWKALVRVISLALVFWLMINPFVWLSQQQRPTTGIDDSVYFLTKSTTNITSSKDDSGQEKMNDVLASGFNSNKSSILQQHFEVLPPWMQEYFHWHHKTRKLLLYHRQTLQQEWQARMHHPYNDTTRANHFPRLLILQCLQSNQKCGGTADRLKPLPLLLLAAARSKRLLLIRWTRPFPLQEFLLPPLAEIDNQNNNGTSKNGNSAYHHQAVFDWTVPEWLEGLFRQDDDSYAGFSRIHVHNVDQVLPRTVAANHTDIVTTLIQWHDGGQLIYDAQPENQPPTTTTQQENKATAVATAVSSSPHDTSEFRRIYHALWRLCFEPVPPIARRIDQIMHAESLTPGEYTVAQYRAFYRERRAPPSTETQRETAINAIQCASHLRLTSKEPVYFASDSRHAVDAVRNYSQHEHRAVVTVDSEHQEELLHLDRDHNVAGRKPKDYYPVFVDLYLMGNGRCMSFGEGGFARFGLILSYNYTCESRHFWNGRMIPCQWV